MRMDARYQIEELCGPVGERAALEYVNVTTYQGQTVAIAADGFGLAVVPVEMEDGDVPGLVHRSVFEAGRDSPHLSQDDIVLALGADTVTFSDGWTAPRRTHHAATLTFPDVAKVVPDMATATEARPVFGVNPRLMVRVTEAIGAQFVACHAAGTSSTPLVLSARPCTGQPEPPFGLVMPAHIAELNPRSAVASAPASVPA